MIETRIQIRRFSSGEELSKIASEFLRRSYSLEQEVTLPLTASVKTEVKTTLDDIAFAYARRTGDSAIISVSKNLSPETWEFADCWLLVGGDNVTSLSFESSADTDLYLYIAGS